MTWSRRTVVVGAVASALSACTPSRRTAGPTGDATGISTSTSTSTATATAPGASVSPTSGATPWSQLERRLQGRLVRRSSGDYERLKQVENPRFDTARPWALVVPASAADVAASLRFAGDHGVPIAVRSGGHCYPGWSAGDGRLVIDCRGLAGLTWQGTTATMGPGRALGDVYAGLSSRGRALPGGSCPTVGLGGLTLGGGVGVLTRAYGLLCDHLTSAQVALPDGRVVTASQDSEPDLFWALRGGGGGHTGVVTSLSFDTVAAPTIRSTYLTWPAARAAEVIPAWFDWIGSADARAWSTLKLLGGAAHPQGLSVGATITWVGPAAAFDTTVGPILATRPTGRFDHTRGYLEAMQAYGGDPTQPPMPFAATSHVPYSAPTSQAVQTLVAAALSAPSSLHETGVSIDALGGHVADFAPGDTAFVHRTAAATMQYTATYVDAASASHAHDADGWVHGVRERMTPFLGDHAYVNYADATLSDPGTSYFGENWARLQRVRRTYDAHGLFTQPQ